MGLVPPTTPVLKCPVHRRYRRKRGEGTSFCERLPILHQELEEGLEGVGVVLFG